MRTYHIYHIGKHEMQVTRHDGAILRWRVCVDGETVAWGEENLPLGAESQTNAGITKAERPERGAMKTRKLRLRKDAAWYASENPNTGLWTLHMVQGGARGILANLSNVSRQEIEHYVAKFGVTDQRKMSYREAD
jgi:hypothetical protein